MKKILLYLPILFQFVFAQQTTFHKQYFVNPFVINPSMVGLTDQMNLFLMHRSQWTSMPDAPITSTLTFDAPIIKGKNGVGVTMFADQVGLFRRNGGTVAYGHQIQLDDNAKLFLGGGINVFDNRIDFSKVEVVQAGDPYVFQNNQNKTIIDLNLGLNLRVSNFDFGLTYNHFGPRTRVYQDLKNTAYYAQEWFVQSTAGYKFNFGENFIFQPLVSFKYFDYSPYQLDLNAILKYKNKVWVAGTYHPRYGYAVSAGMSLYDALTIGYNYDLITNNLKGRTGNSSEIIVGIKFGNKKQKEVEKEEIKEVFVDTDGDGVSDERDLESNTPKGNLVNFQGITIPKSTVGKDTVYTNTIKQIDSTMFYAIEEQMAQLQKDPISFFYDYNRSDLKMGQDDKIVKLVRILLLDTGAKLTLYGNADSSGSDSYNMVLASKRANSIKDILVREFKIDPSRISIVSKGKRDPLAKTRTEVNRRVDADIFPSTRKNTSEIEINDGGSVEPTKQIDKFLFDLFPLDLDITNELIYTTQLGVFRNTELESIWENISPVFQLKLPDNTIRYFSGIHNSIIEAENSTERVQRSGLRDAYTVAFFNGERISIEKAKQLEIEMGSTLKRR